MIYTKLTCCAARLAYDAHFCQVDACGMPYIIHPLHIAEQMDTEAETVVALLHDIVEDTYVTLEALLREGFSQEIVDAVDAITHRKNEPYKDYLVRVKANPLARKVKLADIAHNMDETRFSGADRPIPIEKINRWRNKYNEAFDYLYG